MFVRPASNRPRAVPAGMPVLRRGKHRRPEHGSCLMEYVSVLGGRRFSDRPRCTDPVLARLGRLANDRIRTEVLVTGRSAKQVRAEAFLPLAPALAGIGPDPSVRPVVLDHLTATGLGLAPHDRRLRRLRRRVLAHRLGVGGAAARAGRRAAMVLGTRRAFKRVERPLRARPPSERNAAWVGLLVGVVSDLTAIELREPAATGAATQA